MEAVREAANKVAPSQSQLPTAALGRDGPQITRLGYGAMGLVSLV
jgi:hypothetical protein